MKNSFDKKHQFQNSSTSGKTSVSWFPGHMKKTSDLIKQLSQKTDVIIEVIDARIPHSGHNPLIRKLTPEMPRLIVLNKTDLATPKETRSWERFFQKKKFAVLSLASTSQQANGNKVSKQLEVMLRELLVTKVTKKKINSPKPFKNSNPKLKPNSQFSFTAMICGIPNVGKSTFINLITKGRKTRVGNRPGVTMDKQLLKVESQTGHTPWAIVDMPGLLMTKLNETESFHLSLCGTIKDNIYDEIELACQFIKEFVFTSPPKLSVDELIRYFHLSTPSLEKNTKDNRDEMYWLEMIARRRGYLLKNLEVNYREASTTLIRDFRAGKLGQITLERTDDTDE